MFHKNNEGYFTWFEGKRLLAELRGGDYAHAGSEEAIEKVLARFDKDPKRKILDVGCGLGGTAHFIQKSGWGKVAAFDVEEESINYAQQQYSGINFCLCDACDENEIKKTFHHETFDIICIFHSLCVFPKQFEALKALRSVAHKDTVLAILEYDDLTFGNNPLTKTKNVESYFNIVARDQFKDMLNNAGWYINDEGILDVTQDFRRWYRDLLRNLCKMKKSIITQYGKQSFEKAREEYTKMFNAINKKQLGGCILYATVGG